MKSLLVFGWAVVVSGSSMYSSHVVDGCSVVGCSIGEVFFDRVFFSVLLLPAICFPWLASWMGFVVDKNRFL